MTNTEELKQDLKYEALTLWLQFTRSKWYVKILLIISTFIVFLTIMPLVFIYNLTFKPLIWLFKKIFN